MQLPDGNVMYIIQVYLPCSNHSIQSYRDHLDILHDIVSSYSEKGRIVIIGDCNAHLQGKYFLKQENARSREFRFFLERDNLVAVDTLQMCEGGRSSFVSYNAEVESLIDHIVLPIEIVDTVLRCRILDDNCLNVSSHRPIVVSLRIPSVSAQCCNSSFRPVKWGKIQNEVLQSYTQVLSLVLSENHAPYEQDERRDTIDGMYENIVNCVEYASECCLPYKSYRPFLKPYWDQALKDLHRVMRSKRRIWILNGRPRGRQYDSYLQYKQSKCAFRSYHRKRVDEFLREQNDDIDKAAGVDSGLFWRLFNARKNDRVLKTGGEIRFGDVLRRNPQEIAQSWGSHFECLYSDTDHPLYDNNFYHHVTSFVNDIKSKHVFISDDIVSSEQLSTFISELSRHKMCGQDNVYNEHIIHGGEVLLTCITKLFNMMYRLSYVPFSLKQGIIITLYKGGGKRKDDPKSYRAITLSSCLLKLYERCLLEKLQKELDGSLHPLQGGFRKSIGYNMTSFLLRECITYSNERGSNLYACFLDAKQAFDRVWHDGLFYKLYELGISSSLLSNVIAMHSNMSSCVLYKGHYSSWFPVLQGTRQGGVWSPFLYLCFINGLIEILVDTNLGFSIGTNSYCAPTVADDMLLLSLSRKSLQSLVDKCYQYSCLWRYQYNASKCNVVVFKTTRVKSNSCRLDSKMIHLGHCQLDEADSYKHLGIICDKRSGTSDIVKDCCDKIRGTFFSLVNYGMNDNGLQPLTCKHIYNAVVLPKALYGSECWPPLYKTDILSIERVHRLCLKYIQGLNVRTSTAIVLSLIDSLPIEYEIDKRKLMLIGQLCRLDTVCAIKNMFLYKLCSYTLGNVVSGLLPEFDRILNKYGLRSVLTQYMSDGSFPSKDAWKKMVRSRTKELFVSEWNERTSTGPFCRFRKLHQSFEVSFLWQFTKMHSRFISIAKVIAQLIAYLARFDEQCFRCEMKHSCNFTDHLLLDCSYVSAVRNNMYFKIESRFSTDVVQILQRLSRHELVHTLLGLWHPDVEECLAYPQCYTDFMCTVYRYLYMMYVSYPRKEY